MEKEPGFFVKDTDNCVPDSLSRVKRLKTLALNGHGELE